MMVVLVASTRHMKTKSGKAPAARAAPSSCEGRVDEEAPEPQGDEAMKQLQAGDRATKGGAR